MLVPSDGPKRREFLRRWLYDLHSAVNQRRGVSDTVSWEGLSEWASTLKTTIEFEQFYTMLWKANQAGTVERNDVLEFRQIVLQLRGILG